MAARSMARYSKCLATFSRPQESCFLPREENQRPDLADYCRVRSSRHRGSRLKSRATDMDSGAGYDRRGGKIADPHALVPVVALLTYKYHCRSGRKHKAPS